jgi:murein DD-endopeptidase MepM/ murein hydrolase activator NlpD
LFQEEGQENHTLGINLLIPIYLLLGINKYLSEKNIIEVITVKKNKFTEFFKGKGYYVLLFVGVIAIAAVALIGSNLSSNKNGEEQNNVDLNEPDNNITADENNNQTADNNTGSDQVAENEPNSNTTDTAANDTEDQGVAGNTGVEYEDYSEVEDTDTETAQAEDTTDTASEEEQEPDAVETAGSTVQADNIPLLENLSFNSEDGLAWPVDGNILMNYSMDHTIYYATLRSFKCNPAIIIDAEVGTEVKAAAKGIVTGVEDSAETGITVTTNIGDGYILVYGQLDKDSLTVEKGDKVDEGDVIGTIAEPSNFYSVEGSNLYFKVMENDNTVNPMSLLRE